jgi:hypothetical protein
MLKKVWWCKCSKMVSWKWTICYPMSCSEGGKHIRAGGNKRSHATLKCCCWFTLRFQERRDVSWPWTYLLWLKLQWPNSLNKLLGQWWMSILA